MLAVMKLYKEEIIRGMIRGNKDTHQVTAQVGRDEEHADSQEHRVEGGGQGQQKVELEPNVLLSEGEGDAVRKVGVAAGHDKGVAKVPSLLDSSYHGLSVALKS